MSKKEISLAVSEEVGIPYKMAYHVVDSMLLTMIKFISKNKRLELRNFGVFVVKTKKARKARNPRTGEQVMVAKHDVVAFKPGKIMKTSSN